MRTFGIVRWLVGGSLGIVSVLIGASPVQAQAVVNPTKATFLASADHAAVSVSGPVVTSYELETYVWTTQLGVLSFVKPLGKPMPDAANAITVTITELTTLPEGSYAARAFAVGPGGRAGSLVSDPFARVAPDRAPGAPGKPSLAR